MSPIELRYGGATDVGRVRERNEDAFLVAPPLFAVADGMGGHDGGDVASAIVVEELAALGAEHATYDADSGEAAVLATLVRSRQRIDAFAAEQPAQAGHRFRAGTTAVVALLVAAPAADAGPLWLLANLGDSRIYRFGPGGLAQVSVDHSLVQEMVDAGRITQEEAAHHPERNVVTRAIGVSGAVDPDFFWLPVAEAGRLLLCSDGVSEMLDAPTIASILAGDEQPQSAADALVAAAVEAGGRDNATAVVVDVVGLPPAHPSDSGRPPSHDDNPGALP